MISVVIPCLNEEPDLERTTLDLLPVLEHLSPGAWEVVLVDDGSSDATWDVIRRLARKDGIRAARHAVNRGKGAAVRTGVLLTRGDSVLVCDADGSTPPAALAEFMPLLRQGADIVRGERWGPGAVLVIPQPPLRRLLGIGYHFLARLVGGVPARDYNCGFKLFRGEIARSLFRDCLSDRWTWDVEILALAARRSLSLRAVPVRWRQGPRSQVSPLRDSWRSLRDLASLWWRLSRRGTGPTQERADT